MDSSRAILPDLLTAPIERAARAAGEARTAPKISPAEVHLAALEAAAPPSLLVDERWNVLHLSASVSRFVQQSGGAPARRVTELVRPELRDELHLLLHRAAGAAGPALSSFIPTIFDGGTHRVVMVAQQRTQDEHGRRDILVSFLDLGEVQLDASASEPEPTNDVVRGLREQLRQAERHIDSVRED